MIDGGRKEIGDRKSGDENRTSFASRFFMKVMNDQLF